MSYNRRRQTGDSFSVVHMSVPPNIRFTSSVPGVFPVFSVIFAMLFMLVACEEKKCVEGSHLNLEICESDCTSAKSSTACDSADDGWGYPDGWADAWFGCGWTEFAETQQAADGSCTFGETVGRCLFHAGGEEGEMIEDLNCDGNIYTAVGAIWFEQEGKMFLARNDNDPAGPESVQTCRQDSPAPCQCACTADLPGSSPLESCEDLVWQCTTPCELCMGFHPCAEEADACFQNADCQLVRSCVEIYNCAMTTVPTMTWESCVNGCLSLYPAGADLYNRWMRCRLCDECVESCDVDSIAFCDPDMDTAAGTDTDTDSDTVADSDT